jgi:hypothetical protein
VTVTRANVGSVLVAAIPELREDVEEWADLEHLQFMELWRWTESATRSGNTNDLQRAVCLVDTIWPDCDADIKNAITVSFLEHVDPEDSVGCEIFDALTPRLRGQWKAQDEYRVQLIGKSLRGSVARSTSSRKI